MSQEGKKYEEEIGHQLRIQNGTGAPRGDGFGVGEGGGGVIGVVVHLEIGIAAISAVKETQVRVAVCVAVCGAVRGAVRGVVCDSVCVAACGVVCCSAAILTVQETQAS